MSETVKRTWVKQKIPKVSDNISVPRSSFDVDGDSYPGTLPQHIQKIMGTVIFVYNASMSKVCIQWDLDDTKTDIKIDDLIIEAQGSPKQTIKPRESS